MAAVFDACAGRRLIAGPPPIAAGPGIFYVFRDDADEQLFAVNRGRSSTAVASLRAVPGSRRRAHAHPRFARQTAREDRLGLLDSSPIIGTRNGRLSGLADRSGSVRGHLIVRNGQSTDTSAATASDPVQDAPVLTSLELPDALQNLSTDVPSGISHRFLQLSCYRSDAILAATSAQLTSGVSWYHDIRIAPCTCSLGRPIDVSTWLGS